MPLYPDHLNMMRSCRWIEIDVGWNMMPEYHCRHQSALDEMAKEGYVDALCLNPEIIHCNDFEEIKNES